MRSPSLSGRTALGSVSAQISDPQWNAKYYFMSKWNQGNLMSQLTVVVYTHVHTLTHQMARWAFIRFYILCITVNGTKMESFSPAVCQYKKCVCVGGGG